MDYKYSGPSLKVETEEGWPLIRPGFGNIKLRILHNSASYSVRTCPVLVSGCTECITTKLLVHEVEQTTAIMHAIMMGGGTILREELVNMCQRRHCLIADTSFHIPSLVMITSSGQPLQATVKWSIRFRGVLPRWVGWGVSACPQFMKCRCLLNLWTLYMQLWSRGPVLETWEWFPGWFIIQISIGSISYHIHAHVLVNTIQIRCSLWSVTMVIHLMYAQNKPLLSDVLQLHRELLHKYVCFPESISSCTTSQYILQSPFM